SPWTRVRGIRSQTLCTWSQRDSKASHTARIAPSNARSSALKAPLVSTGTIRQSPSPPAHAGEPVDGRPRLALQQADFDLPGLDGLAPQFAPGLDGRELEWVDSDDLVSGILCH